MAQIPAAPSIYFMLWIDHHMNHLRNLNIKYPNEKNPAKSRYQTRGIEKFCNRISDQLRSINYLRYIIRFFYSLFYQCFSWQLEKLISADHEFYYVLFGCTSGFLYRLIMMMIVGIGVVRNSKKLVIRLTILWFFIYLSLTV
jgi:hypothetical protein